MITSEYGLCNLPHTTLPAGKSELHAAMHKTLFSDICSIPWCFIRGVRADGGSLEDSDVMRGEETELMGLIENDRGDALYVLPGSHSKHISVDRDGHIIGFSTMMTGEFFATVMQNTILRDAADFDHNEIVDEKLFFGYEYALAHGINEALFKTRILKNIFGASKEECFSFLLGAVLCASVFNILSRKESKDYSPIERTYVMFFVGTVGFNIIGACTLGGGYFTEISSALSHVEFIGAIAYLSILSSICAFLLYNYSTTILPPVKSASYSNLITLVSVLAGIFILGETLSPFTIICCLAIVVGVLGTNK